MNYGNIGSDNGLSTGRCQAIIRTNVGLFLIGSLGTNFSEILIVIVCEMVAILSRPQGVKQIAVQ